MPRFLLLFFFFGISHCLFSQDTVNRTDAAGRKNGIWRKVDKDGHKIYDGQFTNGVPSGVFRYYYSDGNLKAISVLSEDGKIARTQSFARSGRKIAGGNYRDEKKDSTWSYYSDYDGVLLSEESYAGGVKEGVSRTFFPNGSVAELITYKNGKKEGEWIQYYDDGMLKFRGAYINDEKDGPFIGYFPGGKVNLSGAYKAGHKDGTWTFYEENGDVMRSEKYSEGALIKEKK